MLDLKVPILGESISEATMSRWLKADGGFVKAEEPVFELETDKAAQEVVAPVSGKLQVLIRDGEKVSVGQVVGRIDDSVAAPASSPKVLPTPQSASVKQPVAESEPVLAPAAQRVVAEKGLDPAKIAGTGPGGRITKEDAVKATEPSPVAVVQPKIVPSDQPRESRKPISAIRKRIAERLVESQQSTATLTTFNEADMSAISDLRQKYKDRFKEKHGVGLGFMSFFVKAAAAALKAYPLVNARLDGNEIVMQNFCDIGVAVSTEKGLMVPILRDADALGFAEIEKRIAQLAGKARDGKISVADLQGGTFTITNGGTFGSMLSTPILNPPQTAILGMHAIQKRAVVVDDQIVIRPMMYLALSYDHRLIDGREAVLFLVKIKECLENPERLMLDL